MKNAVKITTLLVYLLGVVTYPVVENYFTTKAQANSPIVPTVDQYEEQQGRLAIPKLPKQGE